MEITSRSGRTRPFGTDDRSITRWLKDHPPMYAWVVRSDGNLVRLYEYDPKGEPSKSDPGTPEYTITCDGDARDLADRIGIEAHRLRINGGYTKASIRTGTGLTDALTSRFLATAPPNQYAPLHACNTRYIVADWGYGARSEVSYVRPHYADGRPFDTMANYERPTVEEPSKRDLVQYCERIEVSFTITMDRKLAPTAVISNALALTRDQRIVGAIRDACSPSAGQGAEPRKGGEPSDAEVFYIYNARPHHRILTRTIPMHRFIDHPLETP